MSQTPLSVEPDESRVRTEESEANHKRVCPLCEFRAKKRTNIYTHLQTAHRKSTLASVVLDEIE